MRLGENDVSKLRFVLSKNILFKFHKSCVSLVHYGRIF